jgi:hypothetical protein
MKKDLLFALLFGLVFGLAFVVSEEARAEPEVLSHFDCRLFGTDSWVGLVYGLKAVKAAGLCRDERTGDLFAALEREEAVVKGSGVGFGVASVSERISLFEPVNAGKLIVRADSFHPITDRGVDVGFVSDRWGKEIKFLRVVRISDGDSWLARKLTPRFAN